MRKDIEHFADGFSRLGADVASVRDRGLAGADGLAAVVDIVDRSRTSGDAA